MLITCTPHPTCLLVKIFSFYIAWNRAENLILAAKHFHRTLKFIITQIFFKWLHTKLHPLKFLFKDKYAGTVVANWSIKSVMRVSKISPHCAMCLHSIYNPIPSASNICLRYKTFRHWYGRKRWEKDEVCRIESKLLKCYISRNTGNLLTKLSLSLYSDTIGGVEWNPTQAIGV